MTTKTITYEMDVPVEPATELKAGNLSLIYAGGLIRYIRFGDNEVLRMIYPALRDETWKTITGNHRNETIRHRDNGFSVSYSVDYESDVVKYRADFEIRGEDGAITFEMRGEALSSFKSKRIGLCVLHPVSCAGRPVTIVHPENKKEQSQFPVLINPQSPFTEITGMRWNTHDEALELDFEGALFESEDQRNWTDSSFKTYSGPQHIVKMLDIKKGEKMVQRVSFRARSLKYPFPRIGYCRSAQQEHLSPEAIDLFTKIQFDHYRVDLRFDNKNWKGLLNDAADEATLLNTKLELALFFSSAAELQPLVNALAPLRTLIDSLIIFSSGQSTAPPELYQKIYTGLKTGFPDLPVGYGSSSWFTDLNRNPPGNMPFDFAGFLISPQVHQTDIRTVLDNLGSQRTIIDTLKPIVGTRSIHVSPIYLNARADDERLHSSVAAWWTINTIYNFAEAGHLSFYDLLGAKGVLKNETEISPVYELFKEVRNFRPSFISRDKQGKIILENEEGSTMRFDFNQGIH